MDHLHGFSRFGFMLIAVSLVVSTRVGAAELDELVSEEVIRPKGQWYEATVPDTLDLQHERTREVLHPLVEVSDCVVFILDNAGLTGYKKALVCVDEIGGSIESSQVRAAGVCCELYLDGPQLTAQLQDKVDLTPVGGPQMPCAKTPSRLFKSGQHLVDDVSFPTSTDRSDSQQFVGGADPP